MKIKTFRTDLRLGSTVKYKGRKYKVVDFDRNTKEINLYCNFWIRFSEVELLEL